MCGTFYWLFCSNDLCVYSYANTTLSSILYLHSKPLYLIEWQGIPNCFQNWFCYSRSFAFPYDFRSSRSISGKKKTCLDFDIFAQIYTPIWGSLSPQPYWVSGIMNLYISPFIEMFSCISPMTCNFHCICVCILFNSPLFYAFETIVNVFFKLHFPFIVSLDK